MIKLENKPEQIPMIKAIGSKNPAESRAATEAFAAAIGTVIMEVLQQAGTASLIFTDQTYAEDDSPSFPLDLYYNEDAGYITTWSQTIAGGLPSSTVEGVAEMKFSTYKLDSAVNFLKKYARKHNLNVLSKAVSRMLQEVLVKKERMAWSVIMRALAEAMTNGSDHIITTATESTFILNDLSKLITLARRMNQSFADGTPTDVYSRGITDLFVSPEIKEQIRGFAYNGINSAGTANTIALPDNMREQIYRNAGMEELYGIALTDLLELGCSQKYNTLFGTYAKAGIAHSSSNFATADDEMLVGIDLSKGAFIRAVEQSEDGGTFTVVPDDQWVSRSERVGFYGSLHEGLICIDGRAILGVLC